MSFWVVLALVQSPHLGVLKCNILDRWQSGILLKTRRYVKVGIRVSVSLKVVEPDRQ